MTTAYSRIKAHLATWREWELNPVLVKELRQSVRSRVLTGTLLVLLGLLFIASLALLLRQSLSPEENQRVGPAICRALLVILIAATFLFLPLHVGVRLAEERQESGLDLMFITTLAPARIVRGKLFCGAYLALMFFSVCMPFMVFTNLLRGVDVPTILLILICLYSCVCLAVQAAILLACFPGHRLVKTVIGILFSAGLLAVGSGLTMFFFSLLRSGIGGTLNFWIGFAGLIVLILGAIQVLHRMSVSLIIADNRPRGYFNEVIKEGTQ